MKKVLACALIASMSASLLAGCGKKTESIHLKVWCPANQVETGIMEQQQKAFAEAHPDWNITWTTEIVGEDKAKENVLRDVEAAGDVYFFTSDQLVELVDAGAVARLGGETERMVNETIDPFAVSTAKKDDALYGIPFTHNTFYMYYDKTLLDENDIQSIESIMAKETADNVYNFYFESAGGWKLGAWYYGAGLNVFGPKGDDPAAGVDWNNDTGVAVTNYLIDLINNPKCAYDSEITVTDLIPDHRLAAWFDGSWNDQIYEKILGENLGRAVIPTYNLNGEQVRLKGFYGSKCIGVNPHSKNMEAAVAFAAFLGNEENQMLRYEKSGQIPANVNAAASEAVQADPLTTVILSEVEIASVVQPASSLFGSRYWTYANTIPTEIRSGVLNKDNVQAKMDTFVSQMTAK
ncbi:MAG: extracellular solute-binding protein [Lachnospiraceae bacterium]|nr:extracellular solute-binding protein [Lachnospiraceae bacterium]